MEEDYIGTHKQFIVNLFECGAFSNQRYAYAVTLRRWHGITLKDDKEVQQPQNMSSRTVVILNTDLLWVAEQARNTILGMFDDELRKILGEV